jgi:hypothetical protein
MSYPLDLAILKQVLNKHAVLFFSLLLMSLVFCAFGFGFLFFADGSIAKITGILFAGIGIFILLLNFASNFNSVKLYYQHGLLKMHGIEVQAIINHKAQADYVPKQDADNDTPQTDADIERDLTIEYQYIYQGIQYDGYGLFSNQTVFDGLAIGEKIPVMILPLKPNINLPRMTKITNQVKRKSLPNYSAENTKQINEALIDFEL